MHWDGLQTPAWNGAISNEAAKREIADQLASRASNGQVIGIGSGSTSFLALLALSDRVKRKGSTSCASQPHWKSSPTAQHWG